MVVTRVNPTANGPLHLGHVYMLLFNQHYAYDVGGKMYIRFDDTSFTAKSTGDRMSTIIGHQMEDIEWLGIRFENYSFQSELIGQARQYLKDREVFPPSEPEDGLYKVPPYVRLGGSGYIAYPYTPQQTAERVVMDSLLGVTHVIRGEDFLTEYSYYCYVCDLLGFDHPEFIFLPRLCAGHSDISKTNGGHTIAELRQNGYTPGDIKRILAKSCLITPATGWKLYNLKPNPVLSL